MTKFISIFIALGLAIIFTILIFAGIHDDVEEMIYVGTILLALEISDGFFSFGTVEIDEVAAMFLFGYPLGDLGPGLYFALFGICSVRKLKGTIFNDELPADPRLIYHGDDNLPLPTGMFMPIRVKFGQPDPTDVALKDDPYNISMVTEVVPVVNWHISSATDFFKTMGTVENCRKNLEDKTIEVFGDAFASMTPAKASQNLAKTSKDIEAKLKDDTKGWGITINSAFVKPFNFSHGLNIAVVGVSVADLEAKAIVRKAAAKRKELEEEGAGKAEAEKLWLEARAIGIEKLAEKCKTPEGQAVLWMNTLSEALKNSQYSIIPGGELFSSVAGIKEMLTKIKGGNIL